MAPVVCLPSRCHEEPADATATTTATSPLRPALGSELFSTVSSTGLHATVSPRRGPSRCRSITCDREAFAYKEGHE